MAIVSLDTRSEVPDAARVGLAAMGGGGGAAVGAGAGALAGGAIGLLHHLLTKGRKGSLGAAGKGALVGAGIGGLAGAGAGVMKGIDKGEPLHAHADLVDPVTNQPIAHPAIHIDPP